MSVTFTKLDDHVKNRTHCSHNQITIRLPSMFILEIIMWQSVGFTLEFSRIFCLWRVQILNNFSLHLLFMDILLLFICFYLNLQIRILLLCGVIGFISFINSILKTVGLTTKLHNIFMNLFN